MIFGFISDIHGNEIALRQGLEHLKSFDPDKIYFMGDAVGYFPKADEVLNILRGKGILCQKGNHEAMLLKPNKQSKKNEDIYRLEATKSTLSQDHLKWISSWPEKRVLNVGDQDIVLYHGSPTDNIFGYVYPDSDLNEFKAQEASIIVTANTHRPFIKEHQGKTYVNIGSMGLPRDHGGYGSFATLDTNNHEFNLYRFKLNTQEILDQYGSFIHDSVHQCLLRECQPICGTIL